MLAHKRLIALRLCRGIQFRPDHLRPVFRLIFRVVYPCKGGFPEVGLYSIVDCKIDRPCREVAQDRWPKPAVQTAQPICVYNVLHST